MQSVEPPPSRAEKKGRERSEADGDGDSLLFNVELATGAISSILRDSDLKRSGALLMSAKLIYVLSSFHMLFCPFYIHIHVKLIKFPLNLVL